MTITEIELSIPEGMVDSHAAAEMLGITSNNLRQLVWRKILIPTNKFKRKSLFNITDVERVKALRTPVVPSVE
jgi:hypothetical protein